MTEKRKVSMPGERESHRMDPLAFFRPPKSRPGGNGDFFAIALLSAFIIALILIVIASGDTRPTDRRFNFGFGANIDCQNVGSLDPVCAPSSAH